MIVALLLTSVSTVINPVTTTAAEAELPLSAPAETVPEEKVDLPKTVGIASPDQDVDIETASQKVLLHIPEGALDEEAEIEIVEQGQWGPRDAGLHTVFEFNARSVKEVEGVYREIKEFNKGLTLSIRHDAWELRGLDLNSLKLCYLDEDTREWVPVPDSSYNKDTGVVTATINHFSFYVVMANPPISGPGMVMDYLTDLHSGASVSSYPIEVPPGKGGFQPTIQLSYNSGSVDEMKNKRDVGSWVGIGWSLDLGSISYNEYSEEYCLNFNGISTSVVSQRQLYNVRPYQ